MLEGIKCLWTHWIIIWEHFGDPHVPSLPEDLVVNCLLLLDDVDNIPYDEHILWKIQTFVDIQSLDNPKTLVAATNYPIDISSVVVPDNSCIHIAMDSSDLV